MVEVGPCSEIELKGNSKIKVRLSLDVAPSQWPSCCCSTLDENMTLIAMSQPWLPSLALLMTLLGSAFLQMKAVQNLGQGKLSHLNPSYWHSKGKLNTSVDWTVTCGSFSVLLIFHKQWVYVGLGHCPKWIGALPLFLLICLCLHSDNELIRSKVWYLTCVLFSLPAMDSQIFYSLILSQYSQVFTPKVYLIGVPKLVINKTSQTCFSFSKMQIYGSVIFFF